MRMEGIRTRTILLQLKDAKLKEICLNEEKTEVNQEEPDLIT